MVFGTTRGGSIPSGAMIDPSEVGWVTRSAWRYGTALAIAAFAAVLVGSTDAACQKRFAANGIAFEYPSSWFVTTAPLSNGTNPAYRFTVGTDAVRRTPRDLGPCLPGIAAQLPPTAVLAYVREALGADRAASLPGMRRRPRHFRLPNPGERGLCGFGSRARWVPFESGGRALYLALYLGPRATVANTRALSRLVDRMRITPR